MKYKVISIFSIIIMIISIFNMSYASLIDENLIIMAVWNSDIPYAYKEEEAMAVKRDCKNRDTGELRPAYTLKKSDARHSVYPLQLEIYQNEDVKNILKHGYGIKTVEELQCNNEVEAFLATQEAIYIVMEKRNIQDYVVHNEEGQRILNATSKILEEASKEQKNSIELIENNSEWKEYEKDNIYQYKEYKVKSTNLESGTIKIEKGEDVKILDNNGNEKNEFANNDTLYLVVPKYEKQQVKLKFTYEKEGILVYTHKETENLQDTYIVAENGIEKIEKKFDFNIEAMEKPKIEITNIDRQKQTPIQGNIFSILNKDNNIVAENLVTDKDGKITLDLEKGIYYLKQNSVVNNYAINKGIIEIDAQDAKTVKITVENDIVKTQESTNIDKEIHVIEENKNIIENNIKEVSNITNTNVNKEIINQTNETNLHNVNNFINTINRKNVENIEKENVYNNVIEELNIQNRKITGENEELKMTRQDYINYIDMVMLNSIKVPILPVASR